MRSRHNRQLAIERLSDRRMLSVNAELLADLNLGAASSMTFSGGWVELDGFVYFQADDGVHGIELWKSDGTLEGTEMVADVNEGIPQDPFSDALSESSQPTELTVYNNEVYFAATTGDGDELWKTDGTEAGTVQVKDIWEGEESSFPQFLTVFKDELYFRAGDEFNGDELWKTDGTEEGTELVVDINLGENGSFPAFLYVVNDDVLLMSAVEDGFGPELYKTDGTEQGTELVKDIHVEEGFGSFPESFFEFNGETYFIAADAVTAEGNLSSHLFKTDGTEAGTVRVTTERLTTNILDQANVAEYKGHIYFGGVSATDEWELYRTDGTVDNAELVLNLSGAFSGSPAELIEFQGDLYFSGTDETGRQLWRTNGEVGDQNESERLTEIIRDNQGLFPTELMLFKDQLIFNGHDGTTYQVWRTDGSVVETVTNFEFDEAIYDFFSLFFELNDKLLFRGTGSEGLEMWELTVDESTPTTPELLDGDVDGNGKVEFADFLIISANFAQDVSTRGEGDLDGNGRVEFADFLLLSNDFGKQVEALFATDWS